MTFPTANVSIANLDSETDDPSLARADLLDAVNKLNLIISEGGTASGVALLDGAGLIPVSTMPSTISTNTLTLAPGSGVVNIQNVLRLTALPTATILNFTGNVAGDIILCSNVGNVANSTGLAIYNGTVWRGLPLTANVFVNL
jgi:hypothetical protein